MVGKIVLDSSAIVALFFKEDVSDEVEKEVNRFNEYYTVDQAFSEVANAAWKKVYIYGEDENISKQALKKAMEFMSKICKVVDSSSLIDPAFDIALKTGITVYDALFVALASKLNEKLITTDEKLWKKLQNSKYSNLIVCIK